MKAATTARFVWVQVGECGELERFAAMPQALEYLNALRVGKVDHWTARGIWTPNYWGNDYVSLYWGDADANYVSDLTHDERMIIEDGLEENFI